MGDIDAVAKFLAGLDRADAGGPRKRERRQAMAHAQRQDLVPKELAFGVEERLAEGGTWVVDADIKCYFDSIPQPALLDRVRQKVADGKVLGLMEKFLQQGVMESGKGWEPTESGTPQGAVISPLLANIYLDDF